ncbi:hypothetical protein FACS1894219_05830 [Clostridia bacterium]|nr:hypothetical protein FACS1894219_05830 [Clostridia bacterium]
MTPELQSFAQQDAGFKQYCKQYKLVASSKKTLLAYGRWMNENMREAGMMLSAEEKGEKKGLVKGEKIGIEKGEKKAKTQVAINLLKNNVPLDIIASSIDLPFEEIEKLKQKHNL